MRHGACSPLVARRRHVLGRARRRRPQRSDAAILATTPDELADTLEAWAAHGLDGFRLRPAVLPLDLDQIVDGLVPELQRRGRFRSAAADGLLRERFGLERAPSRYATEVAS